MNAPARDLFARMQSTVKETIACEMRGAVMMLSRQEVPQAAPHDIDAEQQVLSSILCEHAAVATLKPLEPRHFYGHFNQRLFTVLSANDERDLQRVADLLDMHGPVLEELTVIRDATPFALATTLRKHVATIMDRWLERELLRTMQQIDAEIRVGALTHDGARARLREHFRGTSG